MSRDTSTTITFRSAAMFSVYLWFIFYQVMTTFMPPPPASTFLAFHPQDNNIIAIGMEDSTIHIYNVRVDEVITIFNCFFHFKIYVIIFNLSHIFSWVYILGEI